MRYSTLYERVNTRNFTGFDGQPYTVRYITLKSGREIGFWDAVSNVETAHSDLVRWFGRLFKLANDDWDWERIDNRVWDLEDLVGYYRKRVEERGFRRTKEERIKQLRQVSGRTEEEAAAFLAKADKLERELRKTGT
jgi:hypothetical protein